MAVTDVDAAAAKDAARAIGEGAIALHLDVTRQESVAAAVSAFGRLDIPANNAGVSDLAPIVEVTREGYRRVHAVDVEGLLFTLQAAARRMTVQGCGGKVTNFASQAGRRVGAAVPIGRVARPEEIGGRAAFLASVDADCIVAQAYNIDGGDWMSRTETVPCTQTPPRTAGVLAMGASPHCWPCGKRPDSSPRGRRRSAKSTPGR